MRARTPSSVSNHLCVSEGISLLEAPPSFVTKRAAHSYLVSMEVDGVIAPRGDDTRSY